MKKIEVAKELVRIAKTIVSRKLSDEEVERIFDEEEQWSKKLNKIYSKYPGKNQRLFSYSFRESSKDKENVIAEFNFNVPYSDFTINDINKVQRTVKECQQEFQNFKRDFKNIQKQVDEWNEDYNKWKKSWS